MPWLNDRWNPSAFHHASTAAADVHAALEGMIAHAEAGPGRGQDVLPPRALPRAAAQPVHHPGRRPGSPPSSGAGAGLVTRRKRCDAEMVSTGMVPSAGLVTSHEADVARGSAWWQRVWRRLMPPPDAELILAQLNGQL